MAYRSSLAKAAMTPGLAADEVVAKWRRRRNALYAAMFLIVPCLAYWIRYFAIVNPKARLGDPLPASVIGALVVTACGAVLSLLIWRCPSCGRPPTRYTMNLAERMALNNLNPSECAHCGAKLLH